MGVEKIMKKILLKSKKTIENLNNLERKRIILKSIFDNNIKIGIDTSLILSILTDMLR